MSEVIPHRPFTCGTRGLSHTSISILLLDQTRTFLSYLQDTTVHMEMPVGVDEHRPGYGTPDLDHPFLPLEGHRIHICAIPQYAVYKRHIQPKLTYNTRIFNCQSTQSLA